MKLYFKQGLFKADINSYPNQVEIESPEQLQKLVSENDYCMQKMKDGFHKGVKVVAQRKIENFIMTDVLWGDIDNEGGGNFTIEDFKKVASKYEYYISTSKSHQKEKQSGDKVLPKKDRFHFFFPLGIEIYDGESARKLIKAMASLLNLNGVLDSKCFDPSRFFYGSPENITIYNKGEVGILEDVLVKQKELEEANKYNASYKEQRPNNALRMSVMMALRKAAMADEFSDYNTWIGLGWCMKKYGFQVEDWESISHAQAVPQCSKKWDSFRLDSHQSSLNWLLGIARRYGCAI